MINALTKLKLNNKKNQSIINALTNQYYYNEWFLKAELNSNYR